MVSLVMVLWQHSGETLWSVSIVDERATHILSFLIFLYIKFLIFKLQGREFVEFYGLADLRRNVDEMEKSNKNMVLKTTGMYAMVRHPMYFLTLMAFLLTPIMSLDRFWLVMMSFIYVIVVIPTEELHLVKQFGTQYLDY